MKAQAYIVHRAMSEPSLEWRKPKDCLSAEPLYTKRDWQGLTDGERDEIYNTHEPYADLKAVEAKLKEKNA